MTDASWGSAEPVVIPGASRYSLDAFGDTWEVQVWVPEGAQNPPALYVVDPQATFSTTLTTAATLQTLSFGVLTAPAVVGIGPAGGLAETFPKRFRDMTPTENAADQHKAGALHGLGKADDFLSLVVDVVAPKLEAAHGLSSDSRGIGGWSLGGLLTCHALLARPADFDRFLAVSPSLWWDDELLVSRAGAVDAGSLAGRRLYMGTGELENDLDRMWPPPPEELRAIAEKSLGEADMVGSAQRFEKALSGSGARVKRDVLEGEHHSTAWGSAMTRGLVELYGTPA